MSWKKAINQPLHVITSCMVHTHIWDWSNFHSLFQLSNKQLLCMVHKYSPKFISGSTHYYSNQKNKKNTWHNSIEIRLVSQVHECKVNDFRSTNSFLSIRSMLTHLLLFCKYWTSKCKDWWSVQQQIRRGSREWRREVTSGELW